MPQRAFVYQDVPTLKKTAQALESALQSGQVSSLQISGISTTTTPMSLRDVETRYLQARYEIFARGAGLHGFEADEQAAALEPKNPWLEKVMRIEQRYPC